MNIKDYNYSMMNALHSVFWYDGLLDQEDDKWLEFDLSNGEKFSRPKYKDDCVVLKLIDELRNKEPKNSYYKFSDVRELCEDFVSPGEFNVIWMMLVEMFGNCGTSPRTGWIEKREECAYFLQQVVEIEERKYQEMRK